MEVNKFSGIEKNQNFVFSNYPGFIRSGYNHTDSNINPSIERISKKELNFLSLNENENNFNQKNYFQFSDFIENDDVNFENEFYNSFKTINNNNNFNNMSVSSCVNNYNNSSNNNNTFSEVYDSDEEKENLIINYFNNNKVKAEENQKEMCLISESKKRQEIIQKQEQILNLPFNSNYKIQEKKENSLTQPTQPTKSEMNFSVSNFKFINTLFLILQTNEPWMKEIITWSEDGTEIEIHSKQQLEEKILPLFFKHGKYSNFVRQLNIYKFKKVNNLFEKEKEKVKTLREIIVYKNSYFTRYNPKLIVNVSRKKNSELRRRKEMEIIEKGKLNSFNSFNSLNSLTSTGSSSKTTNYRGNDSMTNQQKDCSSPFQFKPNKTHQNKIMEKLEFLIKKIDFLEKKLENKCNFYSSFK